MTAHVGEVPPPSGVFQMRVEIRGACRHPEDRHADGMPYHAEHRAEIERQLHALDPDLTLVEPESPEFSTFLGQVSAQDATLARRINEAVIDEQAEEARELFGKASQKGNALTVLTTQFQRAQGKSARGKGRVRPATFVVGAGGLLLAAVLITAVMPEKKAAASKSEEAVSEAVTPTVAAAPTSSLPQSTQDTPTPVEPITPSSTPVAAPEPISPTPVTPTPAAPAPVEPVTPVQSAYPDVTPMPVTSAPVTPTPVPVTSTRLPDPYGGSVAAPQPITAAPVPVTARATPVTVTPTSAFTGVAPAASAAPVERQALISQQPAGAASQPEARPAVVATTPAPATPRAALTSTTPAASAAPQATGLVSRAATERPTASAAGGLVSSAAATPAQSGALVSASTAASQAAPAGGFVSTSAARTAQAEGPTPPATSVATTSVTAQATPTTAAGSVALPGSVVEATLTTPVAVYPGVTHPVWARSADGAMWRGTASLDDRGRILLAFTTVLTQTGTQVPVTAYVESSDGPGIGGRVRTASPNAARTALNGLLTGVQSFVQSQSAKSTTYSASGLVTTQERPQNFWLALGGNLAQAFVVPDTKAQVVPFGQLPAGEPLAIRIDVSAK
ncbi:hypothetical protein J2Y00_003618 [Deinococcus soli (ex Cha et al. 2016)]|uniref:Uncharacterized protein n=1 Tax=Deinococcus soli (ex Cha et al. 2016) TaxID=1309411 RepID=A0AAE3XGD6_9DEIO|nr:hypothetical protein [Deinococcus soli (ex Cha et al. 2016)]MDR6220007.1 hypothetical protein [Deinococcus soli (ex Cha et al. 2016)]